MLELCEAPSGAVYIGGANAMRGTALGRRVVVWSRKEPSRRGARREHVRRVRFSDCLSVPMSTPSAKCRRYFPYDPPRWT